MTVHKHYLNLVSVDDTTGAIKLVCPFPDVTVDEVSWVLNDIGSMTFSIPLMDVNAHEVTVLPKPPLRREVHFWEDGNPDPWMGMVVGVPSASMTAVTFECRSIDLYFRLRKPGPAYQDPLLINPSFEDDPSGSVTVTGWTQVGGGGFPASTTVQGDSFSPLGVLGDSSVQMVLGDGSAFYIVQVVTMTAPASAPIQMEVSAWWSSAVGNLGVAFNDYGLLVQRYSGATFIEEYNAAVDPGRASWSDSFTRVSVRLSIPAGATEDIYVNLFGRTGLIVWDSVAIRRRLATFSVPGEDRSVFLERWVNQAANGAIAADSQGGGPNGDLESEIIHPPVHIRWADDNPDTGVTSPVYIDHDSSSDFLTTIQDFPRQGIADYWIDTEGGASRTFRIAVPRRGSYKPEHALVLGRNIVGIGYGIDGSSIIDQPVIPGADWANTFPSPTLADRDIWGSVSPSPDASLREIEEFRTAEIARRSTPAPISSVTVSAYDPAASGLGLGDTVPVRIDKGFIRVNQDMRVLKRALRPGDETVTFALGQP